MLVFRRCLPFGVRQRLGCATVRKPSVIGAKCSRRNLAIAAPQTDASVSRQTIIATPSKKVYAALGVLYFAWGSTYGPFKVTFERLPPLLTTGTRFALAGLVL